MDALMSDGLKEASKANWGATVRRLSGSLTGKGLLWLGGLGLTAACSSLPAAAAEMIAIEYGGFEAAIALEEVERFATTGELTGDLAGYGGFLSSEQKGQLRKVLQQEVGLNATLVSQLVYSPVGDVVLSRLTQLINAGGDNGDGAELKAALVQAAASDDLTLLNILKEFPAEKVHVDAGLAMGLVETASMQIKKQQQLVSQVEAQAANQVVAADTAALPTADLSQPGSYKWRQMPFDWVDGSRKSRSGGTLGRSVPTNLYLPESDEAVPVVVLSHGMASNRQTLAYLAEHLASHGIAVAVPEHIGSSGTKFQRYFDGVAAPPVPREAIDRPLDVTFILDQLSQEAQLPPLQLERTVVIGQSFGGYTALAVGGAELNRAALRQGCEQGKPEDLLNMSLLLQCQLADLDGGSVALRDERVAAVMAVNPFTSRVFDQAGLAAVDVPVMMVSGSSDVVVPSVEEQLYPFTWLPKGDHHLALMRNATHFSVLEQPAPDEKALPIVPKLIGPHGDVAQDYLSALSLAFVRQHVSEGQEGYLSPAYAQQLSRPEMPLSLVRSLNLK